MGTDTRPLIAGAALGTVLLLIGIVSAITNPHPRGLWLEREKEERARTAHARA